MHVAEPCPPSALEVYQRVCGTQPLLARTGRPETGIRLYRWGIEPVREAFVPRIRDLTVTIHLGGANRVRAFTERGISERCSRPGDVTLIPRGQAIHWLVEGGADFATLHIPGEGVAALAPDGDSDLMELSDCLFAFRDDFVLASTRALLQAPESHTASSRHYVAHLLESLILHVGQVALRRDGERVRLAQHARDGSSERASGPDFAALAEAIEHRLGEPISIRHLATLVGLSRTRFCEQFKDYFGASPHRYVLQRRLLRAQSLLANGARTVTDIAYQLGFSSAAHFSTAFKDATGVSPAAYARERATKAALRGSASGSRH